MSQSSSKHVTPRREEAVWGHFNLRSTVKAKGGACPTIMFKFFALSFCTYFSKECHRILYFLDMIGPVFYSRGIFLYA